MKRFVYLFMMALALPLFVACSSDTEEVLDPETGGTRLTLEWEGYDYYYAGTKKVYYHSIPGKSFIYFHTKDITLVEQKLAERGIEVIRPNPDRRTLNGANNWFMNYGENFEFLRGCTYEGINANYEDILDIPEIVSACPYLIVNDGTYDLECPGTCLFYVTTTSKTHIQKIIDEYKVDLLSSESAGGGLSVTYFFCGRNAKGNAMEICKDLIEKSLLPNNIVAEPSIMSIRLG